MSTSGQISFTLSRSFAANDYHQIQCLLAAAKLYRIDMTCALFMIRVCFYWLPMPAVPPAILLIFQLRRPILFLLANGHRLGHQSELEIRSK